MNNIFKTLAVMGALAAPVGAQAQERVDEHLPVTVGVEVETLSKDVFRGLQYSEGPATWTVPWVGFQGKEPWQNVWVGAPFKYDWDEHAVTEQDFSVEYALPSPEGIDAAVGYSHFTFPTTDFPNTQEVYGRLGFDVPLTPTFTLVYDFDDGNEYGGEGVYAEAGISHSVPLFDKLAVDLSATLGYNHGYFREESGFSHVELGVGTSLRVGDFVNIPLLEDMLITPHVNYSHSLDGDFENHVYGGVKAELSF